MWGYRLATSNQTCHGYIQAREPGCESTEQGCASRACGRSRSGCPMFVLHDLPRRRTARPARWPSVGPPPMTRRSWTRSPLGHSGATCRGLDGLGRSGLCRQASSGCNHSGRSLRYRLGHDLPIHFRSDRRAVVPLGGRVLVRKRLARNLQADGRQGDDDSSIEAREPHRRARQHRHAPAQPGDRRVPRRGVELST